MMQGAQATLLPDGKRLHLHHGPIDLIVEVWGPGRDAAYARATLRFQTILQELVDNLAALRAPLTVGTKPLRSGLKRGENRVGRRFETPSLSPTSGSRLSTARRMYTATQPLADHFITPMAAVAGAVADEILAQITEDPGITKAYVNNGGDTAFHLTGSQTMAIAAPPLARITLTANDPWRGVATSGWQGRSHSFGIADSVTVLAKTAAQADAAATMIANSIDLPGDPRVTRQPANHLSPDSDLGDRLVTTDVQTLDPASRTQALDAGLVRANGYLSRNLIGAACLLLQGDTRITGPLPQIQMESMNA